MLDDLVPNASRRFVAALRSLKFYSPAALLLPVALALAAPSAPSLPPDGPQPLLPSQAAVADGRAKRGAASEARAAYVRSHYAKFEFRIPMRDGVHLFTAVYVPYDASARRRYPMLMMRTPYSVAPYGASRYKGELGPFESYEHEGFIFVYQDVRGCHMSEGQFVNMRPQIPHGSQRGARDIDESTDTYDTIDWLIKNVENNNGAVGMWGISYPGFYAAAGAIDSHPALKAVSPQAPIADWFMGDDMHRHGAFNLELAFGFFSVFGQPRPLPTDGEDWDPFDFGTPDVYRYFLKLGSLADASSRFAKPIAFWSDITAHPNYDDFWKSRNLAPHLRGVRAAMMVVGGWYDVEDLYGPLHVHAALAAQNPGVKNTLVIGPWVHGGWSRTDGSGLADADFGYKTSETYAQRELAFFKHHLKGGESPELPTAFVYETGSNRWRSFDAWPPKSAQSQRISFLSGGRLSLSEKPASQPAGAGDFDEYLSDPQKPVPCTSWITMGCARRFVAEDQRFAASRPDVLVYETEPLDRDLTVAGPIEADLWLSTTGSDADVVIKLIDEYPDQMPGPKHKGGEPSHEPDRGGTQLLIRGEPMRARFRDSYSSPQPLVPNQVTRVRFTLNDVFHTFQRRHRLMVQVQSSWFPYIDRNPQSFVPNIFAAKATDFVKANHRIYHSAAYPSSLVVRVLPGAN